MSYEGVISMMITDKMSLFTVLLIACYLPPANSPWGRNATEFFSHILSIVYQFSEEYDVILLTGDLNCRIGKDLDFIPEIDEICNRKVLDQTKNKHGSELIDFLLEAKLVVCNGRVTPQFDNFTCIEPSKGASVVDYFITSLNNLSICERLVVSTARELIEKHCDLDKQTYQIGRNIPDHSFLKLYVCLSIYQFSDQSVVHCLNESVASVNVSNIEQQSNDSNTEQQTNGALQRQMDQQTRSLLTTNALEEGHSYFTRFKMNGTPEPFLNNDLLLQMINDIEQCRQSQEEIDSQYNLFCTFYNNEMKKHFRYFNVHKVANKAAKRCRKPFWNSELKNLWQDLCRKEKVYLKSRGNNRNVLKHEFRIAQKLFDKTYRQAERKFNRERILELENLTTTDPNKFWQCIKDLGPKKKNIIPLEVYNENGDVVYDKQSVLKVWKSDYSELYNQTENDGNFDDNFLQFCKGDLSNLDNSTPVLEGLNDNISEIEVSKAVSKLKCKRAVGIDNIPNEIFKNEQSNVLLLSLFNHMFQSGKVPDLWRQAIIKPIPKSSLSDPRIPLQYRGISLLSTVYKIYSSILNKRLIKVVEENHIYCEEQNGFRKSRSCMDHIFTLTSIIRNQKNSRKPTFICFVDFQKAFDSIDRALLFYKLRKLKVGGKFFESLRSIYSDCYACVSINKFCTEWFNTNFGVRQGDPLSPTLFGLYINDLVDEMNVCNSGVNVLDVKLNLLLYADDIALIAESENQLQAMLHILYKWCKKWRLKVNISKTNIVHFRCKNNPLSDVNFMYGTQNVEIVSKYKYLGVVLNEFLDYSLIAETLSDSGKRALGAIYAKVRRQKGVGCHTFTKMFHTGVTPILDYCSAVWGNNKYEKIDSVQNKAIRLYLGVHAFAPNLAIQGDMGWVSSRTRRRIEIFRYWNTLVKMNENRIPKKILMWEREKRGLNWSSEVKNMLLELGREGVFYNNEIINLTEIKNILCEKEKEAWKCNVVSVPKLRSFILFKKEMSPEPYIFKVINRGHRSILAQLRCGILPLRIETGRFQNIPPEFRLCLLCNQNCTEDENHFLFNCPFYEDLRQVFFTKVIAMFPNFSMLDFGEKCNILFSENLVKETASFIYTLYKNRQKSMYNMIM